MVYGSQTEHVVSGVAASEKPSDFWPEDAAGGHRCSGRCPWSVERGAVGGDGRQPGGSQSDAVRVGDSRRARNHLGNAVVDHASMSLELLAVMVNCFQASDLPSGRSRAGTRNILET